MIEDIIFIGGNNPILYIIMYCGLNIFTILFYVFINRIVRKKAKGVQNNTNEKNRNDELDDDMKIEIEKILNKEKKSKKIAAYIFSIIFFCFIIIIFMDLFDIMHKKIIYYIYGIIILSSMSTSIQFYEYFIASKIKHDKQSQID
jgi:hypothetical protein